MQRVRGQRSAAREDRPDHDRGRPACGDEAEERGQHAGDDSRDAGHPCVRRAAQWKEEQRKSGPAQERAVQRALSVAAGEGDDGREREQSEAHPPRPVQRQIEQRLQRVVQRYFPFIEKYMRSRPSMITKATAVAMGP